jgi:hypothetical protein
MYAAAASQSVLHCSSLSTIQLSESPQVGRGGGRGGRGEGGFGGGGGRGGGRGGRGGGLGGGDGAGVNRHLQHSWDARPAQGRQAPLSSLLSR